MKYAKYPSFTIRSANALDTNSSSISEADNSPDEDGKTSITYDSDSDDYDKSSNISIGRIEKKLFNGCIDSFIIDRLKPISKSKIKEHTLSYNNLDK